jgi:DNA-binding YbaB/EbfC family protein
MRQAQKMQQQLAKMQEDLGNETVTASVGGGAVSVTMTGQQKVTEVKISPEAADPEDVEMLQELVLSAFNEALQKSQDLASKRLGSLTGGLKLPF